MKSKIETTTPQTQEIDWGKVMLVKSNDTGTVILTTGDHDGHYFCGVVLGNSNKLNIGHYNSLFSKSRFTPLPLPQTITFYE